MPVAARKMLSGAWVRYSLYRRSLAATEQQRADLIPALLNAPLEELVASCWPWYGPMMQTRRIDQWNLSGGRTDILAVDGNAKMHRRTCGTSFAETRWCAALGKYLIRGCPKSPSGTETLCRVHALARGRATPTPNHKIEAHRLRRALHAHCGHHLDVRLEGYRNWQPACTVDQSVLESDFARKAHDVALRRRGLRIQHRSAKKEHPFKKRRREPSFMAVWSSKTPRARSACATHKEGEADVPGAMRSAGFLTAVSESGLVVEVSEIIGAESLSQRYVFLADLAAIAPSLRIVVHDDACHLRLMAEGNRRDSALASRIASMSFIVDQFHASGHVGQWCKCHCLPTVPEHKNLLNGFPDSIAESVNADLSPLGHLIHHFGQWLCQLCVNEMIDVHNLKVLRNKRQREAAAEKKAAAVRRAGAA